MTDAPLWAWLLTWERGVPFRLNSVRVGGRPGVTAPQGWQDWGSPAVTLPQQRRRAGLQLWWAGEGDRWLRPRAFCQKPVFGVLSRRTRKDKTKQLHCPRQHLSVPKGQAAKQTPPINHENCNFNIAHVHHLNVLGTIKTQQRVLKVPFPFHFTALYSTDEWRVFYSMPPTSRKLPGMPAVLPLPSLRSPPLGHTSWQGGWWGRRPGCACRVRSGGLNTFPPLPPVELLGHSALRRQMHKTWVPGMGGKLAERPLHPESPCPFPLCISQPGLAQEGWQRP